MANERAKVTHSRKTLNIKVECTKAVMVAKYNYRMAIQEARMTRCNQLHVSWKLPIWRPLGRMLLQDQLSLQNSRGNMQNICRSWKNEP